jgi:hypothetical protein
MIDIIYSTGSKGVCEAGLSSALSNGIMTTGYYTSNTPTSEAIRLELFNLKELETTDELIAIKKCLEECDGVLVLRSSRREDYDDQIDELIEKIEVNSMEVNFMLEHSPRSIVKFITGYKIKKLCIIGKNDMYGDNYHYKQSLQLLNQILGGVKDETRFVANQY